MCSIWQKKKKKINKTNKNNIHPSAKENHQSHQSTGRWKWGQGQRKGRKEKWKDRKQEGSKDGRKPGRRKEGRWDQMSQERRRWGWMYWSCPSPHYSYFFFYIFIIDNFLMIRRIHVVPFCTVFFPFLPLFLQCRLLSSSSQTAFNEVGQRPCPATAASRLAFRKSLYYREKQFSAQPVAPVTQPPTSAGLKI